MRSLRSSLPLLALGAFATSNAYADFYIHSWQNHHESQERFSLGADFIYYRSTENFDRNKNAFIPTNFDSYSRQELDLSGIYGITQKLSVYGRVTWLRAQVNTLTPATTTTTAVSGSSSAFGFGDQTLGANLRVYERPQSSTAIDLQLQVDFPAYSNSNSLTNNTPYLGDGTIDITAGVFLTFPVLYRQADELNLLLGGGYTRRNSGFSAAIPWTAGAELDPHGSGLTASATINVLHSLETDANTNNYTVTQNTAGSVGNGGSYITNAVNPSLLTIQGKLGYVTATNLEFSLTGAKSVSGQSAPNGFSVTAGFTTHFGRNPQPTNKHPALQSPSEYGRSNQGFVSYGMEAKVLRTNDRFNLIKLDKGRLDGVEVGDVFDIFAGNSDGSTGAAIARGRVTHVRDGEASVKVEEYFKEVWIEEGFTARKPLQ